MLKPGYCLTLLTSGHLPQVCLLSTGVVFQQGRSTLCLRNSSRRKLNCQLQRSSLILPAAFVDINVAKDIPVYLGNVAFSLRRMIHEAFAFFGCGDTSGGVALSRETQRQR